ncbi:hypothetical protein FACS1894180_9180 [Bacteroidia bacterium]|nr:hypothetical protein FACS1894180_9180 [Bacteroidia bacterium]
MKTLKEMKTAMTAVEMNHVKGGTDSPSFEEFVLANPDLTLPEIEAAWKLFGKNGLGKGWYTINLFFIPIAIYKEF